MSRTRLIRPRHPRAVWNRPAAGTRLLTTPHSRVDHSLRRGIPLALSRVEACPEPRRRGSQERNGWGLLPSPTHLNTHYKRCPRAERLHPGSDQPMSRPVTGTGYGRFPDKSRHALLQGSRLRISAPVEGHTYVADLVLAGESQQSDERRLKTNAPFKDSTVVTTGELPTTNAGHGSPLPSLRMVEHFWWSTPRISRLSSTSSQKSGARIPPSSQPDYFRLRTPVSGPRSYPLGWSSTSGGRDCPTPRFSRVSFTSPQKLGAVAEPSPMSNLRWSG